MTIRRTATEDANAGIVDVPVAREKVRGQGIAATSRAPTDTSKAEGMLGVVDTFSTKLQNYAAKENERVRANRDLQGYMDQGREKAIRDIAEVEKRSGLSEMLFGQDAYFEGAQRRAVENNALEELTKELVSVEDWAGHTTQEYRTRIDEKFAKISSQFDGDPQTKLMLQRVFADKSKALVEAHTKERYVYEQTESYRVWQNTLAQKSDYLNAQINRATDTSGDKETVVAEVQSLFDYNTAIEDGLLSGTVVPNKANWTKAHVENIVAQLDAGNGNIYDAAEATGFLQNLPRTTQDTIRNAKDTYDKMLDNRTWGVYTNLQTEADNIESVDDISKIREAYIQNQQENHKVFPASEWPAWERRMRSRLDKLDAEKARVLKATENPNQSLVASAMLQTSVDGQFTQHSKLDNKEKALYETGTLQARIENAPYAHWSYMGADAQAQILQIKTNPDAADMAARNLKEVTQLTKTEKTALQQSARELLNAMQTGRATNLRTEDGALTELGQTQLNNMYTYEKYHPGVLAKTLGDDYEQVDAMKFMLEGGAPLDDIQTALSEYRDDKRDKDFEFIGDVKKKGRTVKGKVDEYEWVRQRFESNNAEVDLTADEMDDLYATYKRNVGLYGNPARAMNATLNRYNALNTTVLGRVVKNGQQFEDNILQLTNDKPYVTPRNPIVRSLAAQDTNLKGGKVPHVAARLTDLIKFGELVDPLTWGGIYGSLGLEEVAGKGFAEGVLERSDIKMEVDPIKNTLVLTAYGQVVPRREEVPLRVFADLQEKWSEKVYLDKHNEIVQRKRDKAFAESAASMHTQHRLLR